MLATVAERLGVPVLPLTLAAGLALGAGTAGWGSYRVGTVLGDRAGYIRGKVDAGHQAELNGMRQSLAAEKADRAAADAAAARAAETAAAAQAARSLAEDSLDAYRQDLARRPRGGCALDDADLDRLRPDHHQPVPAGRDGADAAAGR
ncbi:hypothetical protein [Methylobacterium platani]|jgi:multidrug efflux pump subunit AcrA (membrane-fusion protein)|uniref:Uncharacterized protein n=2 Tax=Methylobacterium platani TaxID=427683 RepID=A0A179SB29_9HYPH|nr:hypothetical protein [Methylobacterium platani]KMO10602.1 hypothetical protein SQ03_29745 [Methylobacterium platani JCM 14648]OAS23949.1 hypothetical protein A5481_16005 [Methylobacterium platani]